MSTRLRSVATAALLAIAALLIYTPWMSSTRLQAREVAVIGQARSVALTGRDLDGRLMPLFFRIDDERWLQPAAVYFTALIATVSAAETAARLASAIIGAVNVALLYALARRLFNTERLAIGSAGLLMITPAHFVYARTGVDAIYVLPPVLLWLIGLVSFLDAPRRQAGQAGLKSRLYLLTAATFALGFGVYATPSGPLTMGFLLFVTLAVLWRAGTRELRPYVAALAGFAAPLAVLVFWFASHPQNYPDTFGRWAIHAAHIRNPLDGLKAFANWTTLGTRAALFWGFFDPSWLFLRGPTRPDVPLLGWSPFLFATLVLLIWGIAHRLRTGPPALTVAMLAGLAAAPLAGSTFGVPHFIGDAMAAVPMVVLLATCGVAAAFERQRAGVRVLIWVLIALLPVEFARFLAAYFGL